MSQLLSRFGKFKSAREVRGAAEIGSMIMERTEDREALLGRSSDRQILKRGDGRLLVVQRGLFSSHPVADPQTSVKDLVAAAGMPWDEGYSERAYPVWSSDERVNRYGDIDLQQWNFDNYNKNPLVLFSHNWDGLPIGSSLYHKTETRSDASYVGPALKQIMLFATAQQSEMADSVERLWKARFLRTVSVGFYPGVVIDVQDQAERDKLGLGKWGMLFGEEDLVEVSPTSVPALPSATASALKEAAATQVLKACDIDTVREFSRKEAKAVDRTSAEWRELDACIRHAWQNLFPGTKIREHLDIDAPAQYDASFSDAVDTKAFEALAKQITELRSSVSSLESRVLQSQSKATKLTSEALASIDAVLATIKSPK